MLIQKAYKYRLCLTNQQAQKLCQLCGCARFVWNYALNETLSIHDAGGKIPSAFDLNKRLTSWKKLPELAFLSEGYTDNLQQKLKDLWSAQDRCFDKSLTVEKPAFKKKTRGYDSIRFVNFSKYCGLDYGHVKLPSGLGWVKFYQSRKIEGITKNCTISQHVGHWYVSFQVESVVTDPIHVPASVIGPDAGITKLAILSGGTVSEPVNSLKKNQDELTRLQRCLARMVKFSANWKKQRAKISRFHSHIVSVRRGYLRKTTTTISKNHAMIVTEDLKVSNMLKSAADTVDQLGHNIAAKSGLNRVILDQGWAEMRRQLQYKQAWCGDDVLVINPAYTSQKCTCCRYTSKNNHRTQASFICTACGYTANADINGAHNILTAGFEVTAAGQILPSVRKGCARKAA